MDMITQKLAKRLENKTLRIEVKGGGCSGMRYQYDLVENVESDDLVFIVDQTKIVVDQESIKWIEGAVFDWLEDGMGGRIDVSNPIAQSGCGCGISFMPKGT